MANQNDNDLPQRIEDELNEFEDSSIEAEMIAVCIALFCVLLAVVVCGWKWPIQTLIVLVLANVALFLGSLIRGDGR